MSTVTDHQTGGIRDPYRSLLILLGGILLALAVLAGQTGYRDTLPSSGQDALPEHTAANRAVAA
ncbi:MAG: hypothetical protein R2864_02695 [Syntrophotaleaceae bacterium]